MVIPVGMAALSIMRNDTGPELQKLKQRGQINLTPGISYREIYGKITLIGGRDRRL
jgi:hypothetical protein